MKRQLLVPKEVAAELRLDHGTVLDLINSGSLPALNVGGDGAQRRWRVDRADLDRWLNARRSDRAA